MHVYERSLSARLRSFPSRLKTLDRDLKPNPPLSGATLREFRHVVDNMRRTAWRDNELFSARQNQKNPQAVISFLTAERMRRFSRMAQDLSSDFEREGATWPAQAVKDLESSLTMLRERLSLVGDSK